MGDLVARLVAAVYGIAVIGFLLWMGLKGIGRVRTVVEYLELRERDFPEASEWPPPPLARQSALPVAAMAVVVAGAAVLPLMLEVALGRVSTTFVIVAATAVCLAAAAVAAEKRSPWAETRSLLWRAAGKEGEDRAELLDKALAFDPQVRELAPETARRVP